MITAIICGAGKGARTGFAHNKLLHEYEGLPVLCRTLSVFSSHEKIDEILVTCSSEDKPSFAALLSPFEKARLVQGGKTRAESVLFALEQAKGEIVIVHDGARPFVNKRILDDCIQSVQTHGSGVCALPAVDTTVLAVDGEIISVPLRERVFTVQTPQGFFREPLLTAYQTAFDEHKENSFTDESGVYTHYIAPAHLFLGERENRKLTFAQDFTASPLVGFGVDTHAFGAENNFIVLAGVKIPAKSGLVAHSDGDVLIHAVMDALLSAAGLRDIGYYFPDTNEKFRGANSMELLQEVLRLLAKDNLAPVNVSVSILAQTPRLSPYIEEMKKNLAATLSLPLSAVGIAAGTNEKLGYIGEGKGITVYTYLSLKRN